MDLDHVARGPRLLRHDRHVALARAHSAEIDLPAFGGPAMTTRKPSRRRSPRRSARCVDDGGEQLGDGRVSLHRGIGGDVGLVGEVEPRLGERLRLHQLLAPGLVERPRAAFGLRERLARLRLGLGSDEIGKAFDLGEIELPFSKARRANSPGSARRTPRSEASASITRADHGAAAMNMQLGHVLAGEARGPRQPEREAAVEQLAGPAGPDLAQGRLARRRRRTAQRAQRVARCRPRDADHRDAGSARRRSPARRWCPFGSWIRRCIARRSPTECVIVAAIGGQMTDATYRNARPQEIGLGARRAPISSSTRTTPSLVGLGARGARRGQARRASRSCSRSATPPAIGAT